MAVLAQDNGRAEGQCNDVMHFNIHFKGHESAALAGPSS